MSDRPDSAIPKGDPPSRLVMTAAPTCTTNAELNAKIAVAIKEWEYLLATLRDLAEMTGTRRTRINSLLRIVNTWSGTYRTGKGKVTAHAVGQSVGRDESGESKAPSLARGEGETPGRTDYSAPCWWRRLR